jgi:hypothetical protein
MISFNNIKSVQGSLSSNPVLLNQYNNHIQSIEKSRQIAASYTYNTLATTFYQSITSNNPLDRSKYLCTILGLAKDANVDPALTSPEQLESNMIDFYNSQQPDYEAFQNIGDSRITLGETLSATYGRYVPRANLINEIQRVGGCQIIENYICTADGVPIQEVTTNCEGIDTTPIQTEEIVGFVLTYINNGIINDADAFVNFIKTNYISNGWAVTLHTFPSDLLFFARATKGSEIVYLRYYGDQKDYVSTALNIKITTFNTSDLIVSTSAIDTQNNIDNFNNSLIKPIPRYR